MNKDRCKVLFVVEATAAGVGRHVTDLLSSLDLEQFEVTLAWSPTRADGKFIDELRRIKARGVTTVAIPMSRSISPLTDLPALVRLTRLIAKERFDIVHGHSSKAGFLARLAARMGRPSAFTVYTPNAISIAVNPLYWYPEKAAGWLTDALISVTESERRELQGYRLVPPSRLRTITAGIPLPEQDMERRRLRVRRELGLPLGAVLIGTVGRVSRQKDPDTFVAAAMRLIAENDNAYFLWIGEGDDRARVMRDVSNVGMSERIRFIGYRSDPQEMLSAVDIFALTSRYESFGYVTCEAMALGKAVVASDVTGTCEVVEPDVTGLLVPPGDDQAFAAAYRKLIGNPVLRRSLGENGKRRVQELFALPRMVSETEQLYLELVGSRPKTSRQMDVVRQPVGVE